MKELEKVEEILLFRVLEGGSGSGYGFCWLNVDVDVIVLYNEVNNFIFDW